MASELRVNTINSRTGFGTITVSETGQDLVGITTIENLTTENTLVGAAASFTGNVSVGGVLTYEDVTNIDSVGLITARQGIEIGARPGVAASVSVDGNAIFSGIVTATTFKGDGSQLTGIAATDNVRTGILDVSGIGTFRSDIFISENIDHLGDDNTRIRFPAADTFSVDTAGTERIRIDSKGNMGLGVTPNDSWVASSDFRALQIGTGFAAFGRGSGDEDRGGISVNAYHTGSAWKYIGNGNASRLYLADGESTIDWAPTNSGGADAALSWSTGFKVNNVGTVLCGNYHTSNQIGSYTAALQVGGTSANAAVVSINRWTNDDGGAQLQLFKGRGTSGGAVDKGQDGDNVGSIRWVQANNNNLNSGNTARIDCNIDAAPGGGDYPSRLTFWTCADGSQTVTEQMRINRNGLVSKTTQAGVVARRNGSLTGFNSGGAHGEELIFNYIDTGGSGPDPTDYYDVSNGHFTAPVTGWYLFNCAARSNNASFTQAWITVGGARLQWTDVTFPSATALACSTHLVKLTAGQYAGYHPYANGQNNVTILDDNNHTYFRVCLL